MTRGTLALVRGDVLRSLAFNPGAALAVVTAIVVLFVLWRRPRLTIPTWLPFAVVVGLWTFQLSKLATGRPL